MQNSQKKKKKEPGCEPEGPGSQGFEQSPDGW